MGVPTLRLTGGPTAYQVFAATGALWATVRGRPDELTSELIAESPQRECLATTRFLSYENRFVTTDAAGTELAYLVPKTDRFATLAGWRLLVPSQKFDAVSQTQGGWAGARGAAAPVDVWFYALNYPIFQIDQFTGMLQWDLLSPPLPNGMVLDWRVAVMTAAPMLDLRLRVR